jgi:L-lactate dehydrogenase (cytochrome)
LLVLTKILGQLAVIAGTWHPIALDAEPHASEEEEEEGTTQPSGQKLISMNEVAKHNTRDDCWVVIEVRPFFPSSCSHGEG